METPPYQLIGETDGLATLVRHLSSQPLVACDLEADSLHHYREKICLLQFSTPSGTWLVDPLAGIDVSLLAPFFADPAIRKVFHGADYDIRSLSRDYGMVVANLFDTTIAAQFLGIREFGLAALLAGEFGVTLDKRHQTADWSKRPLPPGMLDYAALDTHWLLPIYHRLRERLGDGWRRDAVEEESHRISRVRPPEPDGSPLFLRFRGSGKLSGVRLATLEALLQWRDREACRRDRPPFKVIGNESLLSVATTLPGSMEELTATPHMPKKLVDRYGREMLEVIRTGCDTDQETIRRFERLNRPRRGEEKDSSVVAALKEWRTKRSESLAIDPGVLFPNGQLERLSLASNPPPVAEVLRGWQMLLFGEEIEGIVTRRKGSLPPG
ncbi:MAG: ribonuclease D [Desulfuromonadia bacterium]